jgi:uncharacterized secreted protein with C-terminal beta-propeller domain
MQRRQRMNRRRTGSRQAPRLIERLETRHALAVSFVAGAWTIVGDANTALPDDTIVIEQNPANARQLRATINGAVVDVRSAARVKSIHVVGGSGDDSITVNVPGNTRIATLLEGGFGNDVITGGDGPDVILGGPGRDTLNGGAGNDEVRGNGGVDAIVGSGGDDALFGGAGVDSVRGGPGRNTLDGGLAIDAMYGTAGIDIARLDEGEQLVGNESTNPLAPVGDIARLKSWAIEGAVARYRDMFGRPVWPWWGGPIVCFDGSIAPASTATASGPSGRDYSQTPTQVAGVDEGDRVKTDGSHLFAIAGDGIDILDVAAPERLGVISHLALPGDERQLFLAGTRLTVISQEWGQSDDAIGTATMRPIHSPTQWQVVVTVVDVAVPASPVIVETTRLDGWLVDARAIGDRVMVVTQGSIDLPVPGVVTDPATPVPPSPVPTLTPAVGRPSFVFGPIDPRDGTSTRYEDEASYRDRLEKAWNETSLPGYEVVDAAGGESSGALVDPARTSLPVDGGDTSLLSVVSFTVGDAVAGPDATTTAGGVGGRIFASTSGLYVVDTHVGSWWDVADAGTTTNLYKFDLTAGDVPLVAMGSVSGMTLDQFSLDEHNGLLRIATTDGFGDGASNAVTVVAATAGRLEAVGSVSGLARGERIYSVRFAGDRGYVSTFRQIDPLFVIDLSTPTAPRVTGELKVPGYSTHLMPLDDTHLLGVGRDVDPITGRDAGLQLSIFDVGDPAAPKRSATYTFVGGDWGSWSPASWDHHALGWFAKQGILAIPVQETGWMTDLVVFRIDTSSPDAFTRLGTIEHTDSIDRSVRIGDVLYAVSPGQVTAHPLTNPAVLLAAADISPGAAGPIAIDPIVVAF